LIWTATANKLLGKRNNQPREIQMAKNGSRASQNNTSNQGNPNNPAYHSSRQGSGSSKPALDNHANQQNPNHAPTKPEGDSGTGTKL
jgi:hypothetical protein